MVLVCHMIQQNHEIKWSFDFIGGSPCDRSPPDKFSGHRLCGSKNLISLICHVNSQDYVTQKP